MAMSRPAVSIKTWAPEALSGADRDGWLSLAGSVPDATVFMWPAAFEAWRHTIGARIESTVILARRGEKLVGVLPVMRAWVWRGPAFAARIDYGPFDADLVGRHRPFPLRQLSSVVSWRATALRPSLLCANADRTEITRAIARTLASTPGADQILIPVRKGEENPWLEGFRDAALEPWVHELGRSIMTLEQVRPFDEILHGQSANFRKNIKRARAAAAEAGLAFRVLIGHEQISSRMDLLARLAAASWKGQGNASDRVAIPYDGDQRRFFEALLARAGSEIEPVLCIGETADGPIHAALTVRHGQTLTGLLTFRRDVLADASPGLLGKAALVDWCAANDILRFDLNTTEHWLRHLADSSHQIVNVAAFCRTPPGRVYNRLARWRRPRLTVGVSG
jgi:hypothetical protein